ncbi:riboflavin synthase [Sphingomonas paeninsulae]|uniref:Riboflavin synthase n=1 Tax=Sphingomonas paeninsulae TaxID=2319844 RepID=A0A494TMY0_SPHPE|nr:riboflavin synthase [Sphingomonas paeninsulae]AYJ86455.1 riboflavin synthase [Sphingomonas paeninsulae]
MFTGIITDLGIVRSVEARGDMRLIIDTSYDLETVDMGASIACSGVCLTVVEKGTGSFTVDVSAESVNRTASAMWRKGARLNLERACRVGDELGGHIVTGHVDGIGTVVDISPDGDSLKIDVSVPAMIAPFIAEKGSITIDGVSLTVNGIDDQADGTARFSVNIIPHTAEKTTLGALKAGETVNLEIDVLARYLARMQQAMARR